MQLFNAALILELTEKYGKSNRKGDFMVWEVDKERIVLPIYREVEDYEEIITFALKKYSELSNISVNELKQSLEKRYMKYFKTHRLNL